MFKSQTTLQVINLLTKNNCCNIVVPNNHTNLFQPLDIYENKGPKSFITNKYQEWYTTQVSPQLERGVSPFDVKVDVMPSTVKPLRANWIVQYYRQMQHSKLTIQSGFRKALITEAFQEAESLTKLSENPFEQIEMVTL